MQFCPVGYMTIPAAVQAILETLHPDEEQNARADLAEHQSGALPSSYHQYCERQREAEHLLVRALVEDKLVALVQINSEDWTVPQEYWESDGARAVTLNDGILDTHHSTSTIWREHHGRLCTIEEAPFRRWLVRTCGPAAPAGAASAVDTKAFDGTYWGYMMVLAWVYFRERALVERVNDSVINGGTFWQQETLPDGRIELVRTSGGPITPIWLTVLANHRRGDPATAATAPKITCSEAEAAILDKLKAGALTAYGLENDAGDLRPIPALWWADGKVYEGRNGRPYAGPKDAFRSGATWWHGLLSAREQVLTLWPDPLATSTDRPSSTAEEATALEAANAVRRSVGRPTEYDWSALNAEIVRIADLDRLPEKQSELVECLLQWCETTWGKQPAASAVKARVSEIYNRLGRGQKSKATTR